jgi:2-dehydro-3-deoxyphosphooctonate aldolase (KDO 8-P synthase)
VAGADALFLEVHPTPRDAPSDSTNMLQLQSLRPLLEQVLALREVVRTVGQLEAKHV